ncbi:MAG: Uma2 family endonuclease [Firmicutes bacterium]|nr:Uma2 family endonuclease [Bacillota bacterium]
MDGLSLITGIRHGEFISTFVLEFMSKYRKEVLTKKFLFRHEEGALVHWEKKGSPDARLVDISKIDNIERFLDVVNDLSYAQPDVMIFKNNPCIKTKSGAKVAGFPDLLVEVWSDGNDNQHIAEKKALYKTAPTTEHWYISQDDNEIECWLGDKQIATQTLTNVLKSQGGIEFDLRDLAL